MDVAGWKLLLETLRAATSDEAAPGIEALEALALAYVAFARRHPALDWLMTERPFDRACLRADGRLRLEASLLSAFEVLLARAGCPDAGADVLVVFAALHGLAALGLSGRLDLGNSRTLQARVRASARRLAFLRAGEQR